MDFNGNETEKKTETGKDLKEIIVSVDRTYST
jgi:hypothetical protein